MPRGQLPNGRDLPADRPRSVGSASESDELRWLPAVLPQPRRSTANLPLILPRQQEGRVQPRLVRRHGPRCHSHVVTRLHLGQARPVLIALGEHRIKAPLVAWWRGSSRTRFHSPLGLLSPPLLVVRAHLGEPSPRVSQRSDSASWAWPKLWCASSKPCRSVRRSACGTAATDLHRQSRLPRRRLTKACPPSQRLLVDHLPD